MAFPISPSNADVYSGYKYNETNDLWNTYVAPPVFDTIKKSVPTTAGIKEIFRVSSTSLGASGLISLSGTRLDFVHVSIWTWSGNHQANGYGTLTRHNLGNFGVLPVYLDVAGNGSIIFSADWGGSMTYAYAAQLFHGSSINTNAEGTLHTTPDSGYTRYTAS
jgi:hypothetical protein